MTTAPVTEVQGTVPRGRGFVLLAGFGALALLVGSVLPWLHTPQSDIWAWEVSSLWAISGNLAVVQIPPSLGGVILVCGLVLAAPVLLGLEVGGMMRASVSGVVIALGGLTLVRALTFSPNAVLPHAGLILTLAGAVACAVAAVASGDR